MRRDSSTGMEGSGTSVGYRPGYYGSGIKSRPHTRSGPTMAYRVRRRAKPIGMFLVLAAVAVMIASVAPALMSHAVANVPAKVEQGPPPPPYNVFGYVTDSVGTLMLNATVVVLDVNTSIYWNTTTDLEFGFYMVDLNSYWPAVTWNSGDIINVTVDNGALIGWNESAVDGLAAYLQLDVVLNATIPEFPMVIMPVIGLVAIAAVVSLKRRRNEL